MCYYNGELRKVRKEGLHYENTWRIDQETFFRNYNGNDYQKLRVKSTLMFYFLTRSVILWKQGSCSLSLVLLTVTSSFQFSCSVVSNSLWPRGLQHARPPCQSLTPGVYPNSCPLSRWCHPTISSSVVPFSCLQSFQASGSFPMTQFFESGGQRIGVSAFQWTVLPMNTQDWSPLGWTGWISLQSKGLSRVFSNTTVQKHQFFGTQLSL